MVAPKRHAFESGKQDQFMLRLPTGMRDHIRELAAQNRRSMNSEIVTMLEKQVQQSPETKNGSVTA